MKFLKMGELAKCSCKPELEKMNVDYVNAKLEREGKRVYGKSAEPYTMNTHPHRNTEDTHQALLINIEPIERCKHPKEKIKLQKKYLTHGLEIGPKLTTYLGELYQCECGAFVEPSTFEEV